MGAWITIAEHDETKDAARIGKSERVESSAFGQTEGGASGLPFHEKMPKDLDPDEISRAVMDAIRHLVTMSAWIIRFDMRLMRSVCSLSRAIF
jgi:hypothetical protein